MRGRLVLPLVLAALTTLAAAGCSGSSEGAATTTAAPASTTTTQPEITDEEIITNINDKLRPALEAAFEPADVECIIGVLEEGGTGELNADEVVPAYQERCGVTATEVTGVITGSILVDRGATEEQGACVSDAIAAKAYDEVAAMDEAQTNALYEACGIDVASLTGEG